MSPVPGFSPARAQDPQEHHGRDTRQGEAADAGDRPEGRGRASGYRGAGGRADQPRALHRLRGPRPGRRSRPLRAGHERPAGLPPRVLGRRVLAGGRATAPQPRALSQRHRPPRRPSHPGAQPGARRGRLRGRAERHRQDRGIEREKGIESGTLVSALEDALLAAYKKTPGASRHATVEIDDQGDFRVYSIELPPDIEERLLDEARERALEELERIEAENGERSHTLLSDNDLDIDWSDVPEDQVKREDVTPENFGRIAAQTAKQVILQRIREAERMMM